MRKNIKFNHIINEFILLWLVCATSNTLAAAATTEDCKPLVINYEQTHYGHLVNYTDCQGRIASDLAPPDRRSFAFPVKVGTTVTIQEAHGINNVELQQTPIGNGLNVKCGGWLGVNYSCVPY